MSYDQCVLFQALLLLGYYYISQLKLQLILRHLVRCKGMEAVSIKIHTVDDPDLSFCAGYVGIDGCLGLGVRSSLVKETSETRHYKVGIGISRVSETTRPHSNRQITHYLRNLPLHR